MPNIAILTPNPDDEAFGGRWSEVFDRMARPLGAAGVEVEGRAWTEAGELASFDAVLPLTVWGYHREAARWIEAVTKWERAGVRLLNPPDVLRWNSDKRYLERLASRGAPVPPSLFVDRATQRAVAEAAERWGVSQVVVKPQISASAYRTLRVRPGEPLDGGPEGAAIIQPYLPAVEREGETSLFFFSGAYSHAVGKVAAEGDFRVQPEWGGEISAVHPPADMVEAARTVLKAAEAPLLYARVDLVRDLEDRPVLIELELVEPDLYLGHTPDGGAAFVAAVRAALEP
jgi:glutathione synthase/RimK-type ligase-like ATP-grasp enzyme